MAVTPSTMLPLGTAAPDFKLINCVSGEAEGLPSQGSGALLVMFISNHCPFVVHIRGEFQRLADDYASELKIVAINSNSSETHPQDGPEFMKALTEWLGWTFPFLFDETQEVAKAYHAACTPDFFLFDKEHRLFYRGQIDSSRPSNIHPVDGSDLRAALDALLEGDAPPTSQQPSIGCNIKWHPGNEPEYWG